MAKDSATNTKNNEQFEVIFSANNENSKFNATISSSKKTKLKEDFTFVIDKAAIDNVELKKILEISKTADIKGFRKGKIPQNIVKNKYKDYLKKEVLQIIIDSTVHCFIKHFKKRTATEPSIEVKKYDNDAVEFLLSYELFPEVKMPDFTKLKITQPKYKTSKDDIKEALDKLAANNKDYKEAAKTYVAKKDDMVVIDYEGKVDGVAFDGGKASNHELVLGSKSFIDNFEDQLIGTKSGDKKTVKVTFPDPYHSKDLAGKKAEFDVTVNAIKKSQPQKIDDDFAKKFKLKDLKDLEEKITEQLDMENNRIINSAMRKELFDVLDKDLSIEIPETLYQKEFSNIWENAKQELANDKNNKKSEDALKKEYEEMAKRRVRLGILLAEIARTEKIEISQQEMQNALIQQARNYPGQEAQIVEFYQKNPKALEQLKGPIVEDKVVDIIMSKTQKNIKELTKKQLQDIVIK